MRYALMLEPQQGMSYADQLAAIRRAEANGFDAFFRSDHFASFPGEAGKPTTDAWTVLAGLARETERITIGALVSPVTFRHPGVFAKVATTVAVKRRVRQCARREYAISRAMPERRFKERVPPFNRSDIRPVVCGGQLRRFVAR